MYVNVCECLYSCMFAHACAYVESWIAVKLWINEVTPNPIGTHRSGTDVRTHWGAVARMWCTERYPPGRVCPGPWSPDSGCSMVEILFFLFLSLLLSLSLSLSFFLSLCLSLSLSSFIRLSFFPLYLSVTFIFSSFSPSFQSTHIWSRIAFFILKMFALWSTLNDIFPSLRLPSANLFWADQCHQ